MSIEAALAAHLANDEAIYPLVSDDVFGARVFRVIAPTRAGYPRITIAQQPGGENVHHIDGRVGLAQSIFQIDVWDETVDADSTRVLAEKIRLSVDAFGYGTLGIGENTHVVHNITLDPAPDSYTPPRAGGSNGIFNARLIATIWHDQTIS
jgi:hypothetical protein